jgi:hypothetical protein
VPNISARDEKIVELTGNIQSLSGLQRHFIHQNKVLLDKNTKLFSDNRFLYDLQSDNTKVLLDEFLSKETLDCKSSSVEQSLTSRV